MIGPLNGGSRLARIATIADFPAWIPSRRFGRRLVRDPDLQLEGAGQVNGPAFIVGMCRDRDAMLAQLRVHAGPKDSGDSRPVAGRRGELGHDAGLLEVQPSRVPPRATNVIGASNPAKRVVSNRNVVSR